MLIYLDDLPLVLNLVNDGNSWVFTHEPHSQCTFPFVRIVSSWPNWLIIVNVIVLFIISQQLVSRNVRSLNAMVCSIIDFCIPRCTCDFFYIFCYLGGLWWLVGNAMACCRFHGMLLISSVHSILVRYGGFWS